MITNKQIDAELAALYPEAAPPTGQARKLARRQARNTITALLECKPLDVEMSRLQRAALRRLKNKGKR
jgi:hypothetical protein